MRCFALVFMLGAVLARGAEHVSIAAAANLVYALDPLKAEFQRTDAGVAVTSTTGASGNLFAQIKNGAPFDVFLSADVDYPRKIVGAGLGDGTTLRTFAAGRLVLWTTRGDLDGIGPHSEFAAVGSVIRSTAVKKLAIAQPKTAPYGRAAQAVLEKLGVWSEARPKLVIGENISQTAEFIETGNADAGFVALSLVLAPRLAGRGQWMEVPADLYSSVPLDHAVVLTMRGAGNPAARRFVAFLSTEPAKRILRRYGYATP